MLPAARIHRPMAGFTLLEVLVALAILVVVMVTLGQTLGSSIQAFQRLDKKTQAWMVASDKMVELQVYSRWPAIGTQDDTRKLNHREWHLQTTVSKGPFQGTRRIDITASLKDGTETHSFYSLSGLIGKPHKQQTSGTQQSKQSSQNSWETP